MAALLIALAIAILAAMPRFDSGKAEAALLARLRQDQAFSNIRSECLYAVLDNETSKTYQFSVRFNRQKCGGESASDLLDWFAVSKSNGAIVHFDVSNCSTGPYSAWLANQRLTGRSTPAPSAPRTQPQAAGPVNSSR